MMQLWVTFGALLLCVVGGEAVLRCYSCTDCRYQDQAYCSLYDDVCLKFVMGNQTMKACSRNQMCTLTEFTRNFTTYWNKVNNLFSFNQPWRPEPGVYCCQGDFCNSSVMTLASAVILCTCLVSSALWKMWF